MSRDAPTEEEKMADVKYEQHIAVSLVNPMHILSIYVHTHM